MYSDFDAYADKDFEVKNYVHQIYGGQEKESDKEVIISTWQSLYELKKPFFNDFEVVIGDEAHFINKVTYKNNEKPSECSLSYRDNWNIR